MRQALAAYYNGYRLSPATAPVYNPFSLLRCCLRERSQEDPLWWRQRSIPETIHNPLQHHFPQGKSLPSTSRTGRFSFGSLVVFLSSGYWERRKCPLDATCPLHNYNALVLPLQMP